MGSRVEVIRVRAEGHVDDRMVAVVFHLVPVTRIAAGMRRVEGRFRLLVLVEHDRDLLPVRLVLVQPVVEQVQEPVLNRVLAGVVVTRDVRVDRRLLAAANQVLLECCVGRLRVFRRIRLGSRSSPGGSGARGGAVGGTTEAASAARR